MDNRLCVKGVAAYAATNTQADTSSAVAYNAANVASKAVHTASCPMANHVACALPNTHVETATVDAFAAAYSMTNQKVKLITYATFYSSVLLNFARIKNLAVHLFLPRHHYTFCGISKFVIHLILYKICADVLIKPLHVHIE